mmetsp:Transcript_3837/g.2557  ORF Transcript_3837/g.2557 Transcript_3837/m.2557 type:complete len:109 (+) Transcript_3837:136-462(+)|eukprot:CAMPEP_0116878196 /NCGR_PEP_ID=MMETSP0463-20121206/9921_1 /TAXON_ID=181622 /ORGANISM="Strombidinopsis sp, Strain SopsisLIS2011" /LENGTH=108 /DNA_ID=CAMNT_0004526125 /DNA_START=87 /DNA_END=413 /DNA_ORIENTATION=+
MVYAGVNFEQDVYNQGEAPNYSLEEWSEAKFTLGLDFPNLPYFIDSEVKVTEDLPIMKYVCNKWAPHLLGESAAEMGEVEMLAVTIKELKSNITMPCYTTGTRDSINK